MTPDLGVRAWIRTLSPPKSVHLYGDSVLIGFKNHAEAPANDSAARASVNT